MARYDSYILCTSPRSGSTLLCRMLRATGIAGHPESWFHKPSLEDWRAELGLPGDAGLAETVAAAIRAGQAGGPLFALRLQRHSVAFLTNTLADLHPQATTDPHRLAAAFGRIRYIHLTRPDKLAQAISYVVATQSGLWHRNADGSEYERLAPPQEPAYDRTAIATALEELTDQDDAWRKWFARHRIDPLTLDYDTLSANPHSALARVLSDLGLDPAAARTVAAPTARLSDARNRDWAARFRQGG